MRFENRCEFALFSRSFTTPLVPENIHYSGVTGKAFQNSGNGGQNLGMHGRVLLSITENLGKRMGEINYSLNIFCTSVSY